MLLHIRSYCFVVDTYVVEIISWQIQLSHWLQNVPLYSGRIQYPLKMTWSHGFICWTHEETEENEKTENIFFWLLHIIWLFSWLCVSYDFIKIILCHFKLQTYIVVKCSSVTLCTNSRVWFNFWKHFMTTSELIETIIKKWNQESIDRETACSTQLWNTWKYAVWRVVKIAGEKYSKNEWIWFINISHKMK